LKLHLAGPSLDKQPKAASETQAPVPKGSAPAPAATEAKASAPAPAATGKATETPAQKAKAHKPLWIDPQVAKLQAELAEQEAAAQNAVNEALAAQKAAEAAQRTSAEHAAEAEQKQKQKPSPATAAKSLAKPPSAKQELQPPSMEPQEAPDPLDVDSDEILKAVEIRFILIGVLHFPFGGYRHLGQAPH